MSLKISSEWFGDLVLTEIIAIFYEISAPNRSDFNTMYGIWFRVVFPEIFALISEIVELPPNFVVRPKLNKKTWRDVENFH